MKRMTALVLSLVLLMSFVSFAGAATPVESIKLNKTKIAIDVNKTFQLKATVKPAGADKKVKWTTSNKKVATVDAKGLVKGIKAGTATITCTAADGSGVKATCTVEVKGELDYNKYYTQKLKPAMDSIANSMNKQLGSQEEVKNAFNKAKEACDMLEEAHNTLPVLKKDSKAKKYLKALKTNIQEGQKRAGGNGEDLPENDETILKCQQNAGKNLQLYMERIKTVLGIKK